MAHLPADADCCTLYQAGGHFDIGSGRSQVNVNSSQVEVQGCSTDAGEDPGLQGAQLHTPVDVSRVQVQGHDTVGLQQSNMNHNNVVDKNHNDNI